MSRERYLGIGVVLIALAMAATTALAGEVSGQGKNMFVPEVQETFELADGTTASRIVWAGFMSTEDPDSPLHLASMTCSGVAVTRDDSPVRSAGSCDAIDADGDVAFYWWRHDEQSGGKWGFLGGTGKWTGVEGGGTYEPAFQWSDGRMGNLWKGTWKMH